LEGNGKDLTYHGEFDVGNRKGFANTYVTNSDKVPDNTDTQYNIETLNDGEDGNGKENPDNDKSKHNRLVHPSS
jgi:hypothetical protein